jgi:hypothetical protein
MDCQYFKISLISRSSFFSLLNSILNSQLLSSVFLRPILCIVHGLSWWQVSIYIAGLVAFAVGRLALARDVFGYFANVGMMQMHCHCLQ